MTAGEASKPAVSFSTRISIDADQIRRRLEAQLGISAARLVERALLALDRELNQAGQPAE
jgi:hypothetical protein